MHLGLHNWTGALTLVLACTLGMFTACNQPQPTEESGNEEPSVETVAVEDDAAEETTSDDPKPKRESPTHRVEGAVGTATVTIEFGSPFVKERKIWGELVPFDQVWRTGANEASWIEVNQPVSIQGNTLAPGKYGLFTVPGANSWEVIINSVWDQWGAYYYSKSDDVFRFNVTPEMTEEMAESMVFSIDDDGTVQFAWEYLRFSFAVQEVAEEG